MGIRMSKARKKLDNSEVDISYMSSHLRCELICHCCGADVTFVNSYKKNNIEYPALFRLMPNREHDLKCIYNIYGRITEIYADEKAKNFMECNKDYYTISLTSVGKNDIIHSNYSSKADIKTNSNHIVFKSTEHKQYYLSSINKIIKLKEEIEESDTDLEKTLKLKVYDIESGYKFISWDQFYFDIEKDPNRLLENKTSNNKYSLYPVCITGILKQIEYNSDKKYYCINLKGKKIQDKENIFVHIYFHTDRINKIDVHLNNTEGKKVAVFGDYNYTINIKNGFTYHNINIYVNNYNQIII